MYIYILKFKFENIYLQKNSDIFLFDERRIRETTTVWNKFAWNKIKQINYLLTARSGHKFCDLSSDG